MTRTLTIVPLVQVRSMLAYGARPGTVSRIGSYSASNFLAR